jgi:hypothetical protein
VWKPTLSANAHEFSLNAGTALVYNRPEDPNAFLVEELKKKQAKKVQHFFSKTDVKTMFSMFDTTNKVSERERRETAIASAIMSSSRVSRAFERGWENLVTREGETEWAVCVVREGYWRTHVVSVCRECIASPVHVCAANASSVDEACRKVTSPPLALR